MVPDIGKLYNNWHSIKSVYLLFNRTSKLSNSLYIRWKICLRLRAPRRRDCNREVDSSKLILCKLQIFYSRNFWYILWMNSHNGLLIHLEEVSFKGPFICWPIMDRSTCNFVALFIVQLDMDDQLNRQRKIKNLVERKFFILINA